ncbi:MAG: Protein-export membrane protein SecF (TC 3.A.5.1.1) [uncultured Campylobacterales bacterium]|uniref:Protein-export membrane protein SecF n=1 Tax=uncultured Campylobacterales bacterium TaxID=352960 RepID=A0A6S6TDX2_9BACT|nr:MAG: Protein-export membrane protein SecF (TC 3.A.5.1.1) [uncultured Campylobacterales bacterium]
MQIFSKNKTYDFMGKSKLALIISIILVVTSLGLIMTKGLNYGLDFTGGTLVQIKYDKPAPLQEIRNTLSVEKKFKSASITEFGSPDEIIIRIGSSNNDISTNLSEEISVLLKDTGNFEIRREDIVGPKIGDELKTKGLLAMALSMLVILVYVAIRFEFRFAISSIIALFHDITICLGFLVLFQIDINLDILAALLTILGYSLNDTIIVFDRIRENIIVTRIKKLFDLINSSVSQTLSRTILTSLTTFFVVLTLYLFGGEIIKGFSFTLLVGVIVGTYSSVFIASNMLQYLRFDLFKFRESLALKKKKEIEKAKQRAMYESGGTL